MCLVARSLWLLLYKDWVVSVSQMDVVWADLAVISRFIVEQPNYCKPWQR